MSAASNVIIMDPFWNPYIEMQAVDRAHRIGQMRNVQVHRIVVLKTVEDRILALQERKKELVDSALDENASRSLARLGPQELSYLFNGNGNGAIPGEELPQSNGSECRLLDHCGSR